MIKSDAILYIRLETRNEFVSKISVAKISTFLLCLKRHHLGSHHGTLSGGKLSRINAKERREKHGKWTNDKLCIKITHAREVGKGTTENSGMYGLEKWKLSENQVKIERFPNDIFKYRQLTYHPLSQYAIFNRIW